MEAVSTLLHTHTYTHVHIHTRTHAHTRTYTHTLSVAQNVVLEDTSFPADEFFLEQGLLTASWDKIQPYPLS